MPARILIVEDDELYAEYLSLSLQGRGYEIAGIAHDAAQALSIAMESRPDVILMDIILPGAEDGIHASEAIHAQIQVPVLYLTAYEDEQLFQRAKITDPCAYLLKPFNERELQLAIELSLHRHREHSLRQYEQEARFQATFEQAAVGMAHVALDGRWLRVNNKLCDIVGYSRDELLQTTFQAITYPDDLAADLDLVRQVLAGEIVTYTMDKRYIRKDGSQAWVALTVSLARKVDGAPDYFISIIEGISARKRLELLELGNGIVLKALAGGESLPPILNLLVRHMESVLPGAIGSVLLLDPDGIHLRAGAAPGLPEAFNQAINGAEIGPAAGSCGTAAYRRERVIVEDIFTSPLWENYRELATLGGVRACWSVPLLSADGKVLGTFAVYYREPRVPSEEDIASLTITASLAVLALTRVRLEEALRAAFNHQRILFESSPIGLALCKMDGSLVEVNPAFARILGRSVEETLALTYWDITPERYAAMEQAQLQQLETTGCYGPYEKTYLHRDGHEVPVLLQGLILTIEGERFIWSSAKDISEQKQAEEELHRNEEVLRLFVEHSPASIAMFDHELKYIVASRRYRIDYDLGEQSLVGRSHYDVFPEMPDRWKEIHRRCLAGAIEKCEEDSFPRADGRLDWVRWEIRPWYESGGAIGGIILFSEVITQRKWAEEALLAQHTELENLYATTPVGLAVIDRNLRFLRVNERLAAINGKPVEAHLGQTVAEALPELAGVLVPIYRRVLDKGEPVLNMEIHGSTPAEPGVLRDWLASYHPLRAADGSVSGISIAVMEITEQKRAEEAVRESEARYRTLFEYAPDGIVIFRGDPESTLIDANASLCRTLGYTHDEMIKLRPADIVTQAETQHILPAMTVIKAQSSYYREWQFRRKDGSVLAAEVVATSIPDGNLMALIRDITERKHLELDLREANIRLRELSARVLQVQEEERRHIARELHDEIGQSLTAIKITLQSIGMRPEAVAFKTQLDNGVEVADVALQQARSLSLNLRPSQLDDLGLAAALRWNLERQAGLAGFVADFAADGIPQKLPEIVAIACYRIAQEALTNVVRHAEAKQVWLRVWCERDDLCLEVRDDGKGFDCRAPKSLWLAGNSGLAGMEERAFLIGGRLHVDSVVDHGTIVRAVLPLDDVGADLSANTDGRA